MTRTTALTLRAHRPVVVGVDGSVSAQGALTWAAAEASFRRCPLRIVHSLTSPVMSSPLDLGVGHRNGALESAAEWLLTEAEIYVRHIAPDIRVSTQLVFTGAAPALLGEARTAQLLVVGSRGLGGFRGLLVGSVSAAVAAHAPCPVVVVRPHQDGTAFPPLPTGRIVVGVDGSDVSAEAIRFAFQQAARRHVGVTAVHAAPPSRPHPALRVPGEIIDQLEQQLFAESMDSERFWSAGLDLETKLVHSHPAQALIDESHDADLVVTGSHGRGGFTGMLLGSVSQAVLQHAACPVAVVHPPRTRTSTRPPANTSIVEFPTAKRRAAVQEQS